MKSAAVMRRPIRSFVRREGRITPGQTQAIERLWGRYGIELGAATLDLDSVFGRSAARVLEIGFGDGEALLAQAQAQPEQDFLGIEVHRPGVGHLLHRLEQHNLNNVRVICVDAVSVLQNQIKDAEFVRVHIFFPDPWPKKRHHKRRLIQPAFVALLARKLQPDGILHLATDWANYAEQMQTVLTAAAEFVPLDHHQDERPQTKFERRGRRLGHQVWDLYYQRQPATEA